MSFVRYAKLVRLVRQAGRHLEHGLRVAVTITLTVVLLAGTVLAQPARPAADLRSLPLATTGKPPPVVGPSVQYDEAQAHASERPTFKPGDRVTIGFRPRPGDDWSVGGRAPVALPAGTFSGQEMAREQTGQVTAALGVTSSSMTSRGNSGSPPAVGSSLRLAAFGTTRPQVFGFLPYWMLGAANMRYDVLTTIAYFGVGLDGGGNLQKTNAGGGLTSGWGGWTSSALTSVINTAHLNGTRVVLTVESFAWSSGQIAAQAALLSSPAASANAVSQIVAAVRDRGADGVNLDFEPIAAGYASGFAAFVRALRAGLDAAAPGYQLTFDGTGYPGSYPLAQLNSDGAIDAAFIMGYDFRSAASNPVGSIAPLYAPVVYDLRNAVNAYLAVMPASKVILGLPWYGRAWSTGTVNTLDAPNASGATYGNSVVVTYAQAAALAATNGRQYDGNEQTAWTAYYGVYGGTSPTWREAYYDDAVSLRAKIDYTAANGLRGSGIWALGYDGAYPDLWTMYATAYSSTDTTPPLAGILPLPPVQGGHDVTVGWTGSDVGSGIASYDVQVSVDGGAYAAWLTATPATSAVYPGSAGHDYAFRVRARDLAGNLGAFTVSTTTAAPALAIGGFLTVTTNGLNVRTAPNTSSTVITTVSTPTSAAIVGGPIVASGYSWYQISFPLPSWGLVGPVTTGWVAAGPGWVVPIRPPNVTTVPPAPTITIGDPAPGTTRQIVGYGATVTYAITDNSGRGLVAGSTNAFRQISPLASPGLCANTWTTDGGLIYNLAIPYSDWYVSPGNCYRWLVFSADATGSVGMAVSGTAIDVTPTFRDLSLAPGTITTGVAGSYRLNYAGVDNSGSGIVMATYDVLRETTNSAGPSSCGTAWTTDGSLAYVGAASYLSSGLTAGRCYRWTIWVADAAGHVGQVTSGAYNIP